MIIYNSFICTYKIFFQKFSKKILLIKNILIKADTNIIFFNIFKRIQENLFFYSLKMQY